MLPLIPLAISLAAEFVPSLVGRVAGPKAETVAQGIVGHATAAAGESDPSRLMDALRASPEAAARLQEALLDYEKTRVQEETRRLGTVNDTSRMEAASEDAYVRRMRPTFGYVMAMTWAAQMAAITWAIVKTPAEAARIIESIAGLTFMWAIGLSVLGVYVWKRSEEKGAAGAGGSLLDHLPLPLPGKR